MTGFSKITSFVQDQVIPSVLNDTDAVTQEEKIRLMRELRLAEEQMRVHSDAAGEFEVVTQLELPPRPEIYRELPVSKDLWNSFKVGCRHTECLPACFGGLPSPAYNRENGVNRLALFFRFEKKNTVIFEN